MKKVAASTIAEVVIALTIIAVCFAVASQVFLQTNRSAIQFTEVKEQTEFQSMMLDALINDTLPQIRDWKGELGQLNDAITRKDLSAHHLFTLQSNEKNIWQQDYFSEK